MSTAKVPVAMRRCHRLALPAVALLAALQPAAAGAQEPDRALDALRPAPAAREARGAPVLRQEWARRLLPADRMALLTLRPVDQALLDAARDGRWDAVLPLLQPAGGAGLPAHADATDDAGTSVLVLAAAAGQDSVLRLLLQQGADIERRGADGFTALGAAAFRGHVRTVRLLLQAGADPLRPGSTGQTALHLAALAGEVEVLRALLRAGLAIDLLNIQRESALDVAAAANQAAVMDLLIQGGGDLTMAGRR